MKTTCSYNLPIGPIHPALKEPLEFIFEIEGEQIINVDFKLSHVHRGIEWAGQRRNIIQIIYLAERICGICSICHPLAFCQAVEHAAEIEIPERAAYLRTIHAEIERIHSHILWAGVAAHELGFDSLLHLTWRVREKVMDLIEYLTGNRVNKAILMVGGVRRDITAEHLPKINDALQYYKGLLGKVGDLFLHDPTIKARTQNAGVLKKEDAIKLCAVGPTTRASGVPKDVRQDMAYAAYADLDVKAITPDMLTGEVHGDVYDRIIVRLLELGQSIEILEQCIDAIPSGDIVAEPKMPKLLNMLKKAEGEGVGRHEAPRGEVIHYVNLKAGQEEPYTWKVRAPTYNNLLPWVPMLVGEQIADIPIVAASTDPCFSCTNRVTLIKDNQKAVLTNEDLHKLSIAETRRLMQ